MALQQDKQQVMPEAFYFQGEKLVVFLQVSSSLIRIWPRWSQFPSSLLLSQPHSLHMGELSFL